MYLNKLDLSWMRQMIILIEGITYINNPIFGVVSVGSTKVQLIAIGSNWLYHSYMIPTIIKLKREK